MALPTPAILILLLAGLAAAAPDPSLQERIDATPDGATIYVESDTLREAVVVKNRKGLTIAAIPGKATLTTGKGFKRSEDHRILASYAAITIDGCEGVEIRGLNFDGANQPFAAIAVRNSKNCRIVGNRITGIGDNANAAILADGNEGNLYEANILTDITGYAVRGMWIGGYWGKGERGATIRGNVFDGIGATAIGGHPVGYLIEDNHVRNVKGAGVAVGQLPTEARAGALTIIRNNRFVACGYHGVQCDVVRLPGAASDVLIDGNHIELSGHHGIYVAIRAERWTIRGNFITNNGTGIKSGAGVLVAGSSDVTIAGNKIDKGRHQMDSIRIEPWGDLPMDGVIVVGDNELHAPARRIGAGVEVGGSK